ncbi:GntR family transcriptional regulator [Ruegeria pomeroyi]|uniref:GntR family transcriptional regulator n=1 Tax=Ruegeria pomeroyi TaxID=89184 RepID=A0A9Q3WN72_9RHOB|nr:GntR family transcriptional regulator [Ruegeria pomeroyi]MCE8512633.1 GntR family transcriptional regulator [Ruegeria pomeroyi]MCE8521761.1 GntR family transcriptional regulator [Ruegeria pomeroyi]MCE8529446.1 GntR family transcriptional regulator [Ruegeria pomeroyi]MCE8538598.1 GntR family transcriptional regulator [Ruegeria pomeroyi]MCE8547757.1 GntR family transcriptional regulator [Ruegeria pomeroyi]
MIKKAASGPTPSEGKQPVHEQVYQMLRARILFGELAPGQAVTIQGLTDSLGVGMTPVREAIRRLMSEGALSFQGNRRVSVPVLTQNDLQQVIFVRKSIEAELARRAAERMTPEAVARLVELDSALDQAIESGDVGGYLRSNYDFHALLYQVADAPILTEMAERLWLRFGPSLRVVCGRFGTQNLPDRHKEMLDALRAGDVDGVALAMEQDVEQGMEQMAGVLAENV